MQIAERNPFDLAKLRSLIARERDARRRDRLRAALLAIQGKEAVEIAAMLGRSRRAMQEWVYAYRDGLCALRGKDVAGIPEREFGVRYTVDGAYRLLHRLGYSSLRPRPRHEKRDPAKQQEFRERAPLLSSS